MQNMTKNGIGQQPDPGETMPDCAVFLYAAETDSHFPRIARMADLTGAWRTEITIFQKTVHLIFHVTVTDRVQSTFDCPEAKLMAIPVRETSLCRGIVTFEMDDFDAGYSGIPYPERQEIEGVFRHGGYCFAATLHH